MSRPKSDAWRVGRLALFRYKENKSALTERIEIAQTKMESKGNGCKPLHPDLPMAAAMRLETDAVYQRLKREVRAVEKVLASLDEVETSVIEQRFFKHRKGLRCARDMRYIKAPMSERSMWRLQKRVILAVAHELGEE